MKIAVLILSLAWLGLLGFSVDRERAQARAIGACTKRISALEEANYKRGDQLGELGVAQHAAGRIIDDLQENYQKLNDREADNFGAIQSVLSGASSLRETVAEQAGDTGKRLDTLERWQLLRADPALEIIKTQDAELSFVESRIDRVENTLRINFP